MLPGGSGKEGGAGKEGGKGLVPGANVKAKGKGALALNAAKRIGIKVLQGAMQAAQQYVTNKVTQALMNSELMDKVLKAIMRSLRRNMEYQRLKMTLRSKMFTIYIYYGNAVGIPGGFISGQISQMGNRARHNDDQTRCIGMMKRVGDVAVQQQMKHSKNDGPGPKDNGPTPMGGHVMNAHGTGRVSTDGRTGRMQKKDVNNYNPGANALDLIQKSNDYAQTVNMARRYAAVLVELLQLDNAITVAGEAEGGKANLRDQWAKTSSSAGNAVTTNASSGKVDSNFDGSFQGYESVDAGGNAGGSVGGAANGVMLAPDLLEIKIDEHLEDMEEAIFADLRARMQNKFVQEVAQRMVTYAADYVINKRLQEIFAKHTEEAQEIMARMEQKLEQEREKIKKLERDHENRLARFRKGLHDRKASSSGQRKGKMGKDSEENRLMRMFRKIGRRGEKYSTHSESDGDDDDHEEFDEDGSKRPKTRSKAGVKHGLHQDEEGDDWDDDHGDAKKDGKRNSLARGKKPGAHDHHDEAYHDDHHDDGSHGSPHGSSENSKKRRKRAANDSDNSSQDDDSHHDSRSLEPGPRDLEDKHVHSAEDYMESNGRDARVIPPPSGIPLSEAYKVSGPGTRVEVDPSGNRPPTIVMPTPEQVADNIKEGKVHMGHAAMVGLAGYLSEKHGGDKNAQFEKVDPDARDLSAAQKAKVKESLKNLPPGTEIMSLKTPDGREHSYAMQPGEEGQEGHVEPLKADGQGGYTKIAGARAVPLDDRQCFPRMATELDGGDSTSPEDRAGTLQRIGESAKHSDTFKAIHDDNVRQGVDVRYNVGTRKGNSSQRGDDRADTEDAEDAEGPDDDVHMMMGPDGYTNFSRTPADGREDRKGDTRETDTLGSSATPFGDMHVETAIRRREATMNAAVGHEHDGKLMRNTIPQHMIYGENVQGANENVHGNSHGNLVNSQGNLVTQEDGRRGETTASPFNSHDVEVPPHSNSNDPVIYFEGVHGAKKPYPNTNSKANFSGSKAAQKKNTQGKRKAFTMHERSVVFSMVREHGSEVEFFALMSYEIILFVRRFTRKNIRLSER